MLNHESYHYAILRETVAKTRSGEENVGWQTNLAGLDGVISSAGLESGGRQPTDALLLMRGQGKIVLQKIFYPPAPRLGFVIMDFSDFANDRDFFGTPFNICVLPEGTAYLSELEDKARADLESARMAKMKPKKRFAVGTRVIVGMLGVPGTVTFVADSPSTMGEYIHKVRTEHGERTELGCSLELIPETVTNSDRRPVSGFRDVHFHGDNSRLNVSSTDNSTNIVSQKNHGLFLQMREVAEKGIADEAKRSEIVGHIAELENTQGKDGFLHAYERFIGLAADHMTLFAPFLPMLMHIAAGKF